MLIPFKFVQRDKQGNRRNTCRLYADYTCTPPPLDKFKCEYLLHNKLMSDGQYQGSRDLVISVGGAANDY